MGENNDDYKKINKIDIRIKSIKTTVATQYSNESKTHKSKISEKISKSILEQERNYLENPEDYQKTIEVK
jgi:hypothetical protein